MEVQDSVLKCEFEDESYYFCTGLCMVTFDIQLERIIAERDRLFEDVRISIGIGRYEQLLSLKTRGYNDHARHA